MIKWGISANSHDAAIAVFDNDKLVYAGHSERYSRKKNDGDLDYRMVEDLRQQYGEPDRVIWYEKPLVKTWRQFTAGQGIRLRENNVKQYLKKYNITAPITYKWHHESHAAAGYYTSPYDHATIVVIDAIGEFESLSIWHGSGETLTKVWSQNYPNSIGLWYSAMTDRIGLKANEEEYILMGMAALGNPERLSGDIIHDFIRFTTGESGELIGFKRNLHRGCKDWRPDLTTEQDMWDIAAATQHVYELLFHCVLQHAKSIDRSPNLVIMGGCALNCVANSEAFYYYKNIWIMPNPTYNLARCISWTRHGV